MVGNMVRLLDTMSIAPFLYFICCELSPLIRSNAVWNTMMVDKAFCKSVDCSFGRSIEWREGKSISRESVCSRKNKALPFSWRKLSNLINLHQVTGWLPLGKVLYCGLSVALCCQEIGYSGVATARSSSVSGSPCCWAHPCHHDYFVYEPTGQW